MHGDIVAAGLAGCGFQLRAQIIGGISREQGIGVSPIGAIVVFARGRRSSGWSCPGDASCARALPIAVDTPFQAVEQLVYQIHPMGWPTTRPGERTTAAVPASSRRARCSTTGRRCCGLELCPAYVDVIVRRWQAFTGRTAIHQASSQSFDERAASQDPDGGSSHG